MVLAISERHTGRIHAASLSWTTEQNIKFLATIQQKVSWEHA